ncbi:MAG: 4Fe-4S binding protein [Elusimicrobium sp.]|nr:4Fe-4S binding protein [Elusimicrobium sp.]
MAHKIDASACINCGACEGTCPVSAISEKNGKRFIDPAVCIDCGACVSSCPVSCISPQ